MPFLSDVSPAAPNRLSSPCKTGAQDGCNLSPGLRRLQSNAPRAKIIVAVSQAVSGRDIRQPQSRLLSLPAELRQIILRMTIGTTAIQIQRIPRQIYTYAPPSPKISRASLHNSRAQSIPDSTPSQTQRPCSEAVQALNQCPIFAFLPPLTRTCHLLYRESIPVFYTNTTISFKSPDIFLAFSLSDLSALSQLRRVHIHLGNSKPVPTQTPASTSSTSPFTPLESTPIYATSLATTHSIITSADKEIGTESKTPTSLLAISHLRQHSPHLTHLSLTWSYQHQLYNDPWPLCGSTITQIAQFRDLEELSLRIDEPPPGPVDCGHPAAEEGKARMARTVAVTEQVLRGWVCRDRARARYRGGWRRGLGIDGETDGMGTVSDENGHNILNERIEEEVRKMDAADLMKYFKLEATKVLTVGGASGDVTITRSLL